MDRKKSSKNLVQIAVCLWIIPFVLSHTLEEGLCTSNNLAWLQSLQPSDHKTAKNVSLPKQEHSNNVVAASSLSRTFRMPVFDRSDETNGTVVWFMTIFNGQIIQEFMQTTLPSSRCWCWQCSAIQHEQNYNVWILLLQMIWYFGWSQNRIIGPKIHPRHSTSSERFLPREIQRYCIIYDIHPRIFVQETIKRKIETTRTIEPLEGKKLVKMFNARTVAHTHTHIECLQTKPNNLFQK